MNNKFLTFILLFLGLQISLLDASRAQAKEKQDKSQKLIIHLLY
jgi:hypothetical protein